MFRDGCEASVAISSKLEILNPRALEHAVSSCATAAGPFDTHEFPALFAHAIEQLNRVLTSVVLSYRF